jgi:hypothetical protein
MYLWRLAGSLMFMSLVISAASAAGDEHGPVFTDPQKAGIDYELQGEYLGECKHGDETQKIGIQVIALGDGKFRAVAFVGGLPGEGWSRGAERRAAEGKLENDQVKFVNDDVTAELRKGSIALSSKGKPIGELKKVSRTSPTLGAKPPSEAVVLFDGTSVDAFEKGKLVEGNLLGATGCVSKQKWMDHRLHIEFRTPFMPKATGQARGNSGVYVQGRYEVQVLDSFGLEGKDNECGGLYSFSQPKVNMCFPPLTWQTYDIDFTAARYDESGNKTRNARITVKHNGVIIHDDIELPKGSPGNQPEAPSPEGLYLQDHGNPVVFRNIWIIEKPSKS